MQDCILALGQNRDCFKLDQGWKSLVRELLLPNMIDSFRTVKFCIEVCLEVKHNS